MHINPGFSLYEHDITPCSDECVDGVRKADTADDAWHHHKCPNHTVLCCSRGDGEHVFNLDKVLRTVNQHGRMTDNGQRRYQDV